MPSLLESSGAYVVRVCIACVSVCVVKRRARKKREEITLRKKNRQSPFCITGWSFCYFFFYSSIVFNFRFDNDIGHPKLRRNEFEQENESIVHLEVCGFLCFVRVIFSGGTDGLLSTRPTQNNWTVNCNWHVVALRERPATFVSYIRTHTSPVCMRVSLLDGCVIWNYTYFFPLVFGDDDRRRRRRLWWIRLCLEQFQTRRIRIQFFFYWWAP